MCLQPRKIVNPTKFFDLNKCQQLYLTIPCGCCSECVSSYRNEWRIRSYYECLNLFSSDEPHFVYFDTLTYDNIQLPHLSDMFDISSEFDFPCFSKYDVQCFIKRLRKRLEKYEGVRIRYLVCSEYGSVKYTARPHYHVIFFVYGNINPEMFSVLVASSWSNGITDGLPFKTSSYVMEHNVISDFMNANRVYNYVCKYVVKDYKYCRLADIRLNKLKEFDRTYYDMAKSYVRPFHLQSSGFGLDSPFLVLNDILQLGCIRVANSQGILQDYSLPAGYKRKLLYDFFVDSNKVVNWRLNDSGFKYKKLTYRKLISNLCSRLSIQNCVFNKDYSHIVGYTLFYAGRLNTDGKSIEQIIDDSFNIDSGLRNYSAVDKDFIHKKVYTYLDYGSKKFGFTINNELVRCSLSDIVENGFVLLSDIENALNPSSDPFKYDKTIKDDSKLKVERVLRKTRELFNL